MTIQSWMAAREKKRKFKSKTRTKAGTNYLLENEEKTLFKFLRNRKDKQAERDYLLLRLVRATGIRRGEALALNIGDIQHKDKITIDERIAEKGGVGEVYLSLDIQTLLKRFLRLKRSWGENLDTEAPLFISRKGHRLSLRSFNDLMDKWCALADIPRYTPHALRHTKAQRIMAKAEDPRKALLFVNKQLRQKSLNSTLVYTLPNKTEMERVGDL